MLELVHAQKLIAPAAWRGSCMGAAELLPERAVYISCHAVGHQARLWQVVDRELSVSHANQGRRKARALCKIRAFKVTCNVCRLPCNGACLLFRSGSSCLSTVSHHKVPLQIPRMPCSSCKFELPLIYWQCACLSTTKILGAAEQICHLHKGVFRTKRFRTCTNHEKSL